MAFHAFRARLEFFSVALISPGCPAPAISPLFQSTAFRHENCLESPSILRCGLDARESAPRNPVSEILATTNMATLPLHLDQCCCALYVLEIRRTPRPHRSTSS